MGCNSSKDLIVETRTNRNIDQSQFHAARKSAHNIDLMIIGTGDSGKTTLRKQLASLHGARFKQEEYRRQFAQVVVMNLIEGYTTVLKEMETLSSASEFMQVLQECAKSGKQFVSPEAADVMKTLNENPEFQEITAGADESGLHLQDCWREFCVRIQEYPTWGGEGWVPSADDCIRSRARTTGVIKDQLTIEGIEMNLYDVGGQRAERRKWLHMFEDISATIFVTAISEYDQVLFEDRSKNRLEESIDLFRDCVQSSWLSKADILLFLNKKDIFHQKFSKDKVPLNVSGRFPDAPTSGSEDEAIKWLTKKFLSKQEKGAQNRIYTHLTSAVDRDNVQQVFEVSRNTVLLKSLKSIGMAF